MKPSLFAFATKELSQDAFFCWLLSWSINEYENNPLNIVSNRIIEFIVDKNISIEKIDIQRQKGNIDFYIRINEKIIIVFEDKIKTNSHNNQLEKYKNTIFEWFPNDERFFIYIKSDLVFPKESKEVEDNGFKVIDIYKIFSLLQHNIKNDIYMDYFNYIENKINRYKNFEKIKYSLWKQDEWYGFIYWLIDVEKIKYDSYGFWQGRELWFKIDISDLDNKKYCVSLEIKHSLAKNSGRLTILLHIEDNLLDKKSVKNDVTEKLKRIYKNENIEINNRIGKISTVINFKDFPVINQNGYFDYIKTKEYLLKIINEFGKI